MQRILVVDDDLDLLDMLRLGFETAGFAVLTATNGIEALKQARTRPELIILDLVLPEMDGFTVCETLRRDRATASIPIVLLTGLCSQFNRFAGLEGGANEYITKPVRLEELIARVKSILSNPGTLARASDKVGVSR